jgi:2-methylcitrate dehydratase
VSTTKSTVARDLLLQKIAEYVTGYESASPEAHRLARLCLMDSLGCALQALQYPACTTLLGPVVADTTVPNGAKVPGTSYQLDPVTAAYNFGMMIRWLDFNDAFTAGAGHPSDNIGGVLAVADYVSRRNIAEGKRPLVMREVLTAIIKAHEVHGIVALENNFGAAGLDHGWFGRVATAAVAAQLLGGGVDEVFSAVSNACLEVNVRTFRQKPNTGSRKSWQGGDSTARGVWLAFMAMKGEMGYPSAISAPTWGFCDVAWNGEPLRVTRELGCYVMENVMFKISYPAGAHAQAAIESAVALASQVEGRLGEIERIVIRTHEKAMKVMDKTGPLRNPADRDHCMQYIVAVGLLFGTLTARDYEDEAAADPRIDTLRSLMQISEEPAYTSAFYDKERAANPTAIEVHFKDGTSAGPVETPYPIGHPNRRTDAIPLLLAKFRSSLALHYPPWQQHALTSVLEDETRLDAIPVPAFVDMTVTPPDVASFCTRD